MLDNVVTKLDDMVNYLTASKVSRIQNITVKNHIVCRPLQSQHDRHILLTLWRNGD